MTEPTALTIRHMKIEDYPLVYGLWTRCTGFTMRDIDDCKDAIKTFLKRNPDTCFVAEDDGGRIIGAILAGHDGRRSRIYHTAVDPDARGRGIGSMLVGRVVETLRTIGLPKVAVGVPADNDAGNDGRRSRIYHTAVDPDARGRGIGSMLVGRVVETLRAIGLPKVAVGVPADNDAGNDFWERQGFAVRDDLVYRELPL